MPRMNDVFQPWLAARAATQGMLACGVRLPDGACLAHSFNELCPPTTLEKILSQLAVGPWSPSGDAATPRRITWTFEHGQVRLCWRPDGALLGLVTQSKAEAAQEFDALSAEFLALNPAGCPAVNKVGDDVRSL